MTGILPRHLYPPELRHPSVRGVFIGGCCLRGVGSVFYGKAHAHTGPAGHPFTGWICVRRAHWLGDSALMLHELAHVVTGEGHTARWRRYLLRRGGTLYRTKSMRSFLWAGREEPSR
jgi:hypothetical protein